MTLKIARVLVGVCFIGSVVMALPLMTQNVTDAVQNQKLDELERRITAHDKLLDDIGSKQNYQLGGIAGMYALLGIIGLFNTQLIKKRKG